MGGYVVAHLKRDIVQLGEKVRRLLFSKCICFYWFLVFLKFWIFSILNTYFSTTISVISDLVLLSFELRILNFGFFKSHCQPLNFGFFLWSWALKTRLEGSVFFAGGVLYYKHTVKYLASDLPRRWFRDEDKPVFHEWFRLRCFAFTHYIMQRTEGSFLTTSLQNLICIIYAQYPRSAH